GGAVIGGGHVRREDVHVVVGEHLGHIGEQAVAVQRLDLDLHQEHTVRLGVPLHVDHALGLAPQTLHVGAVLAVDRDPGAAGDEPDDRVPGDRHAALGQFGPQVAGFHARHDHARIVSVRGAGPGSRAGPGDLGHVFLGAVLTAE